MYTRGGSQMVAALANERYISLTTYKRDGTPVSTPVWVVTDDGERLLVWSAATTWKVRRLRREPRVLVAASNFRGRERGPRRPGSRHRSAAPTQVRLAEACARPDQRARRHGLGDDRDQRLAELIVDASVAACRGSPTLSATGTAF